MPEPDRPNAKRDEEFARIALPLLPAIARVARALTRNEADADDLVQDTYLKALRGWDTFIPGSDARRWLSAICRNTFFAQRARDKWVIAAGDDLELETFAAVSIHQLAREGGIEDIFERQDIAPAIAAAIESLDPIFADVVRLADVQDLTYEETAEILGIPVGTVRSRLYRARRQLQEQLVKFAVDAGFRVPTARHPERSEGSAVPVHRTSHAEP